jgi:hypothetical protein
MSTSLAQFGRRRTVVRALRAARRCCGDSGSALTELSPRQRARVNGALARAEARAAWPLPWGLERRLPPPARERARAPRIELEARLGEAAGAVELLSPHPVALGVAAELLEMLSTLEARSGGSAAAPPFA